MPNNQETETRTVEFYCTCDKNEVQNEVFTIIKGSDDGETITEQEIFCPSCDEVRLILNVPGIIPPDSITRGGM